MSTTVGIMDALQAFTAADSPLDFVLSNVNVKNEAVENPILSCGLLFQQKKGEDFALIKTACQRIPGDGCSTYSVFGIFDAHNGPAAAMYCKEHLLNNVMNAIPSGPLTREEWLAALPQAMVAGFVKTDSDFQKHGR